MLIDNPVFLVTSTDSRDDFIVLEHTDSHQAVLLAFESRSLVAKFRQGEYLDKSKYQLVPHTPDELRATQELAAKEGIGVILIVADPNAEDGIAVRELGKMRPDIKIEFAQA